MNNRKLPLTVENTVFAQLFSFVGNSVRGSDPGVCMCMRVCLYVYTCEGVCVSNGVYVNEFEILGLYMCDYVWMCFCDNVYVIMILDNFIHVRARLYVYVCVLVLWYPPVVSARKPLHPGFFPHSRTFVF